MIRKLRHAIETAIIYIVLAVAYYIMKLFGRHKGQTSIGSGQVQEPPESPIPSLDLALALDPDASPEKLLKLVSHEDKFVRRALTRNPSLPAEGLEQLSNDSVQMVVDEARMMMAEK